MGLQVQVRWHLAGVVDQDLVSRRGIRPQLLRSQEGFYLRVILAQPLKNGRRIRINHNLIDSGSSTRSQ